MSLKSLQWEQSCYMQTVRHTHTHTHTHTNTHTHTHTHTDGRTDRHDEASSRFLQFCEPSYKPLISGDIFRRTVFFFSVLRIHP